MSTMTKPQFKNLPSVSHLLPKPVPRETCDQTREVAPGAVRKRAYQIYVERRRNGDEGDRLSDWLRAERELNGTQPCSQAPMNGDQG